MTQQNEKPEKIYDEEGMVNEISLRMLMTDVEENELVVKDAGKAILKFDNLREKDECILGQAEDGRGPVDNTNVREQ